VHVILESATSFGLKYQSSSLLKKEPQLLVFSANDQISISETVRQYEQYADSRPELLQDLAYPLAF
jgi:acyl transferase domain-containing protein